MYTATEAAAAHAANPKPNFAPLPVIYAKDMLHAAYRLTADDRANLTARADWIRLITGTTDRQAFSLTVRDCYAPHPIIGSLDLGAKF